MEIDLLKHLAYLNLKEEKFMEFSELNTSWSYLVVPFLLILEQALFHHRGAKQRV